MISPDMMEEFMLTEGMPSPAGPSMGMGMGGQTGTEEAANAGFTVLIEGYSPYQKIFELLDPPSVGDDQSRWGFVTRLRNLGVVFPKTPFELFGKGDVHFRVETGLVELNPDRSRANKQDMPEGIGVLEEKERVPREESNTGRTPGYNIGAARTEYVYIENVLIDPMTHEEISRTYDIVTQEDIDNNPEKWKDTDLGKKKYNPLTREELFIDHDHWFRIQAKFVWKDAPKTDAAAVSGGGMMGMPLY